ncbi:unnamed protein product [Psylliodes chrysocephalus]|uniref:DUF4817 domain-containing protein n=1 Tax=Psylliodes chrysocephalus TaxID=3402493 RepID=A0A9P0GJ86_9CUCU|nr:unnamed protein product [Psylliodes chrysocephala]
MLLYCVFLMPLLLEEAVDIIAPYFECLQNATIAARLYALRYGSRMFTCLANRFRNTGSVLRPLHCRQGTRRTEGNVINVLAYVEFDPQLSVRVISRDLGIPQTTVFGTLEEHRSPDLTCLDFYLWGRLKNLVFCTRSTTRENMIQRITDAIRSISRAEVEKAVLSTRERLELCVQNDGRQFEHLGRH